MRYKRVEFTAKEKLEIFHNAGGRCQGKGCGRRLTVKDKWRADHILPIALGGKTEIKNGQLLGGCCDPEKTANDIRRIRKADRQGKYHLGIKRRKGPPMAGTKASRFKKRVDGQVVLR